MDRSTETVLSTLRQAKSLPYNKLGFVISVSYLLSDKIEMNAVVYELLIGDKKQIGSTSRLDQRMNEHKKALEDGKHYNRKMQNTYNKYKSFEYQVLSYHKTRKEAYIEEQRLLDIYFNTEKYLMLNSKATVPPILRGDKNSFSRKEVIKRLIETKKRKGSLARSQETRNKISAANKGRRQSEEEIEKRSLALKSVKASEEYKSNHRKGCLEGQKHKETILKLNSTQLFRENNPSYKIQTCIHCNKEIQGASAFKRFHGENCNLKN